MRGRWPWGLNYIDQLDGSDESKKRLKVILETLGGQRRLLEACAHLDLGETRFHQLREVALQAALTAIEPKPSGRPTRLPPSETEQIRVLQQRVHELEHALHVAQVREEIAVVLPRLQRSAGDSGAATAVEKKTRPPRVKIRKPR